MYAIEYIQAINAFTRERHACLSTILPMKLWVQWTIGVYTLIMTNFYIYIVWGITIYHYLSLFNLIDKYPTLTHPLLHLLLNDLQTMQDLYTKVNISDFFSNSCRNVIAKTKFKDFYNKELYKIWVTYCPLKIVKIKV